MGVGREPGKDEDCLRRRSLTLPRPKSSTSSASITSIMAMMVSISSVPFDGDVSGRGFKAVPTAGFGKALGGNGAGKG